MHNLMTILFTLISFTSVAQLSQQVQYIGEISDYSPFQKNENKRAVAEDTTFKLDYTHASNDNQFWGAELRKNVNAQYIQAAGMMIDTFFSNKNYHVNELDSFAVSSADFICMYHHRGGEDTLFLSFRNAETGDYSVGSVLERDTFLIDSSSFSGANEWNHIRQAVFDFPESHTFAKGAVAFTMQFAGTDSSRFAAIYGFENEGACPGENFNFSSDGSPFYPRSFYSYNSSYYPYETGKSYRDCNGNGKYDTTANEEPLFQNLAVILSGRLYPEQEDDQPATTHIREQARKEEFNLYPTPTDGRLKWDEHVNVEQLRIFDLQGRQITSYSQLENSIDLDIPAGIYMAEVVTKNHQVYFKKIVKT